MPLLVIYNPVCGPGTARSLFEDTIIPLIVEQGHHPDRIEETTHEGHAGEIVLDFLRSVDGPVSIVLGSGDGTLHEIVCALHAAHASSDHREINIALVPCGTANALYATLFPPTAPDEVPDKLQSLRVFLGDAPTARPLTLATTRLISPSAEVVRSSVSAVVASTALHASILHDSEALRAEYPGIERFKLAAQQNIARWYHATVHLLPPCSRYLPDEDRFVPCEIDELPGPFAYFLSTVNVDRLEPFFRITPLHSTIPPPPLPHPPTLDAVVIRPLRDPSINDESEESREHFAKQSMVILGGAYQDGAHAKMVYSPTGQIVAASDDRAQETVVEYFRCGGWEWIPVCSNFITSGPKSHSLTE